MRTLRLVLLLVALGGCRSTRSIQSDAVRTPAALQSLDDYYRQSWGIARPAAPSCSLSCDEVELWAGARAPREHEERPAVQPNTVLQLLKVIKDKRPDYLAYHTFATESFSLQAASPKHPRAVVYGCDGKTMLTFNGRRGQKGFERLEMMCFDDQRRTFDFRELTFPKESFDPAALEDLTPEERTRSVVLSPVNGHATRSCTQCHGTPARPIQDSYNLWPRFYGAFDDNLSRSSSPEYRAWAAEAWLKFGGPGRNRFRGRYAVLPPLALTENEENRPNDAMGIRVHYLNGERIVAELTKLGPAFAARKYKFAQALLCTSERALGNGNITPRTSARAKAMLLENYDYVVEKYRAIERVYGRPEFRRVGADAFSDRLFRDRFSKWYPERSYVFSASTNASDDFENADVAETLASFEKIVAPLGVDIKNWSTILHGGYSHGAGEAGMFANELQSMLERPFLNAFLRDDFELINAIKAYKGTPDEYTQDNTYPEHERRYGRMCEILARRSR